LVEPLTVAVSVVDCPKINTDVVAVTETVITFAPLPPLQPASARRLVAINQEPGFFKAARNFIFTVAPTQQRAPSIRCRRKFF
jgi:hypothetical protein